MSLQIDREQIAKRISEWIDSKQQEDPAAYSYAAIGGVIGKSREAIRQYAKGDTWPRLDALYELSSAIGAPIEWLLFGVRFDDKEVAELRQRACVSTEECQVLDLFRRTNTVGQQLMLVTLISLQSAHPIADNVETFPVANFQNQTTQAK